MVPFLSRDVGEGEDIWRWDVHVSLKWHSGLLAASGVGIPRLDRWTTARPNGWRQDLNRERHGDGGKQGVKRCRYSNILSEPPL